jgi:hypothetical protein
MKLRNALPIIFLATMGAITTVHAALPDPGMEIVPGRTALLITDPQNDFLSTKGAALGALSILLARCNEEIRRVQQ